MSFTANDVATITNVMKGGTPNPGASASGNSSDNGGASGASGSGAPPPSGEGNDTPPPAAGQGGTTPPPAANTPPAFDVKTLGFNTVDELQGYIKKSSDYEKQLAQLNEYKAGPKFKSDRHKFIYDLADRSEGMELTAVRQLIDVVDLLGKKDVPDQHIRYEAFKLRPENKGLSQDEVSSLFMAEELEKFGNPQDTANPQSDIQKIRAKQATAQARETLEKMRNDWEAARPAAIDPEKIAQEKREYTQFVQEDLKSFDGIPQIKLSATDEKGEKLEGSIAFKTDPEKQLPAVIEAVVDPQGWWDRKLEQFGVMAKGKEVPDIKKFADLVTRIEYMDLLLNSAYQQGGDDRIAAKLKGARNISDPSAGSGAMPDPPKVDEKKSANAAAMKTAGIV